MIHNILLYPYNLSAAPFVEYCNQYSTKYRITKLVSPFSYGLTGKDGKRAFGYEEINMIVESDFYSAMEECDTLLVYHNENEFLYEEILSYIKYTLSVGKNVICNTMIREKDLKELQDERQFIYYDGSRKDLHFTVGQRFRELNVPIIFVGNIMEDLNGSQTAWKLTEKLKQRNIDACLITKDNAAELVEQITIPEELFTNRFDNTSKIQFMNDMLYKVEKMGAQIVILDLPYPVIKTNSLVFGDFGVFAYLFSQAAPPDYIVLNVSYEAAEKNYYYNIGKEIGGRLGQCVDSFCMYNVMIDDTPSPHKEQMEILHIDYEHVDRIIQKLKGEVPIYSANDDDSYEAIVENIIKKLSE